MEDLKDRIVGSQSGTTGMFTMEDAIAEGGVLAGTKTESRPYTSAPIAMEDLKSGRIDAVIIDEQVAMQLSNQNDGYKAIPLNYQNGDPVEESYGVAIPKGNPDLVEAVNAVIAELKAGDQINKWLVELSIADE